eukprot:m.141996 g.141996  ORF g.141996 m.141996 type:complete len:1692 (-) comp14869_c0_seq2:99-5174(-)
MMGENPFDPADTEGGGTSLEIAKEDLVFKPGEAFTVEWDSQDAHGEAAEHEEDRESEIDLGEINVASQWMGISIKENELLQVESPGQFFARRTGTIDLSMATRIGDTTGLPETASDDPFLAASGVYTLGQNSENADVGGMPEDSQVALQNISQEIGNYLGHSPSVSTRSQEKEDTRRGSNTLPTRLNVLPSPMNKTDSSNDMGIGSAVETESLAYIKPASQRLSSTGNNSPNLKQFDEKMDAEFEARLDAILQKGAAKGPAHPGSDRRSSEEDEARTPTMSMVDFGLGDHAAMIPDHGYEQQNETSDVDMHRYGGGFAIPRHDSLLDEYNNDMYATEQNTQGSAANKFRRDGLRSHLSGIRPGLETIEEVLARSEFSSPRSAAAGGHGNKVQVVPTMAQEGNITEDSLSEDLSNFENFSPDVHQRSSTPRSRRPPKAHPDMNLHVTEADKDGGIQNESDDDDALSLTMSDLQTHHLDDTQYRALPRPRTAVKDKVASPINSMRSPQGSESTALFSPELADRTVYVNLPDPNLTEVKIHTPSRTVDAATSPLKRNSFTERGGLRESMQGGAPVRTYVSSASGTTPPKKIVEKNGKRSQKKTGNHSHQQHQQQQLQQHQLQIEKQEEQQKQARHYPIQERNTSPRKHQDNAAPLKQNGTRSEGKELVLSVPPSIDAGAWPVGTSTKIPVLLENLSSSPLECRMSVACEEEVFVMYLPNVVIVGPNSHETVIVVFHPKHDGLMHGVVRVSASPVRQGSSNHFSAEHVSTIHIQGRGTHSAVKLFPATGIDFGVLPEGSVHALPVDIECSGHNVMEVVVRLTSNSKSDGDLPFGLSIKKHSDLSLENVDAQNARASLPSHSLVCVLDPLESTRQRIWVTFYTSLPSSSGSTTSLDGKGFEAILSATPLHHTGAPTSIPILASVSPMSETEELGLLVPGNQEIYTFVSTEGSTDAKKIPLKNTASHSISINATIKDKRHSFSLQTPVIDIPGQSVGELLVVFNPKTQMVNHKASVTLLISPSGDIYNFDLSGSTLAKDGETSTQSKEFDTSSSQCRSMTSPTNTTQSRSTAASVQTPFSLLCNRAEVCFLGINLNEKVRDALCLRNNSQDFKLSLRVWIINDTMGTFSLLDGETPEGPMRITLDPQGETSIGIEYTAKYKSPSIASLVVKVTKASMDNSEHHRKYYIPLSGYGGSSKVVMKSSRVSQGRVGPVDGFNLGILQPGKMCHMTLTLQNKGDRAAFLYILFTDFQGKTLDPSLGKVAPASLVIQAHRSRTIRVTYRISEKDIELLEQRWRSHGERNQEMLAVLVILSGDELLRKCLKHRHQHRGPQQTRDVQQFNGGPGAERTFQFNSVNYHAHEVPEDIFIDYFDGEELVRVKDADLHHVLGSHHIFRKRLTGSRLAIMGSLPKDLESQKTSSDYEVDPADKDWIPLVDSATDIKNPHWEALTWSIKPHTLNLSINHPSTFTIQNHQNDALDFDLIWPAHALSVTPASATVSPKRSLTVTVTAKAFPHTTHNQHHHHHGIFESHEASSDWHGKVFILCNGKQVSLDVSIEAPIHGIEDKRSPSIRSSGVKTKPSNSGPHTIPASKSVKAIYFEESRLQFRPISVGSTTSETANLCNNSPNELMIKFRIKGTAFALDHSSMSLRPYSFVQLPIVFEPPTSGQHMGSLIATCNGVTVVLQLQGRTKEMVWK